MAAPHKQAAHTTVLTDHRNTAKTLAMQQPSTQAFRSSGHRPIAARPAVGVGGKINLLGSSWHEFGQRDGKILSIALSELRRFQEGDVQDSSGNTIETTLGGLVQISTPFAANA